eukprot:2111802-Alexandrium_andersonii.AAC.1
MGGVRCIPSPPDRTPPWPIPVQVPRAASLHPRLANRGVATDASIHGREQMARSSTRHTNRRGQGGARPRAGLRGMRSSL